MSKVRIVFEKKGKARYISHLDLMRTMQRVFIRAGIKIKHTEGFNPHPYIVFALPLSVGAESQCELMDFDMQDEHALSELPGLLNGAMPEGIVVTDAYEPTRKFKEMQWLSIYGELIYDGKNAAAHADALRELFARKEIVMTRKTKKGMGEADIAPMIRKIEFKAEGDTLVKFAAVIHAQEPTLNPGNLVEAIKQLMPKDAPEFFRYKRIEFYDEKLQVFR